MVRAAFFDLDKTILDTSSNVALSGPFIEAGLMNRRTALTSVLVQLPYLLAGADESRMEQMAQALGRMGRGWNAAFLEATVEDALERTIQPVCYAQALARIEQHKRAGDIIVIASASVEQVVRPIAQMLGADEVLASR
ncbi:MAG: haloacid dehalogenase-like hydrolase, partial [Schaalia odontolytica]